MTIANRSVSPFHTVVYVPANTVILFLLLNSERERERERVQRAVNYTVLKVYDNIFLIVGLVSLETTVNFEWLDH